MGYAVCFLLSIPYVLLFTFKAVWDDVGKAWRVLFQQVSPAASCLYYTSLHAAIILIVLLLNL